MPAASMHDAAVLSCMRTPRSQSWGGQTRDAIRWTSADAWPALAQHPAVFHADGRPLTIVEVAPKLVITTTPGGTQVQVVPRPGPSGFAVNPVGQGYEFTRFSSDQMRVSGLIGVGLVVPREGQAALDELLAASGHLFEQTTSADRGRRRDVPPHVVVRLAPDGGGVLAELAVQPLGVDGKRFLPGEGGAVALAQVRGEPVRLHRNLQAESDAAERILSLPGLLSAEPAGDAWRLASAMDCLELLEALQDENIEVYWPEGASLTYRNRLSSKRVNVSVRAAGAWFEASGEVALDDGLVVSLKELLEGVLSARGRFVQLRDGSWLSLTQQLRTDLDAVARTAVPGKRLPTVHALASRGLQSLVRGAGGSAVAFREQSAKWDAVPAAFPVPKTLRAQLRSYQEDAFVWLARLGHLGLGGILADDMGLGKTVTTLAVLVHRQAEGPALAIAPTSVAGNWSREAFRFAPSLRVHLLRDTRDRARLVGAAQAGDLIIASYGLLVSEAELLATREWSTVVFDESQALKNAATQRHQAALAVKAGLRIALTGTPVENHSGELHAQVSVVNPGMLGDANLFRKRFQRPIETGDRSVQRQLRALVTPYLLRRTKEQVLDELPPRTDIDVPVQPTEVEAALYEAQRLSALESMEKSRQRKTAVQVLAHLTRLRLLACAPSLVVPDHTAPSSKRIAFDRIVSQLVRGGHRALVFSQFLQHLALLREHLDERGITYQYLDGSTPAKARDQAVRDYQNGDDPLFLISTRAGGQGINLTAADYVIHMDPWWNPAVEDQASDRAHRMGQTRPVTVYRLFTMGTVEEEILKLHRTKRDLADDLLSGADVAARMSADQLMDLMRR